MKMVSILGFGLLLVNVIINVKAQQFYCPGQTVEYSCRQLGIVIWQGTAFTGQCSAENDTITFFGTQLSQADQGSTTSCGIFTATIVGVAGSAIPGLNVVDTRLRFVAELELNGTTVQCEDADSNNTLLVDSLLVIPETTAPLVTVNQVSQQTVAVNLLINESRCVSTYNVSVTQEGGDTTNVSDTSSPVTVSGLDICRYNYSFVGFTTSMNGEQSGVSVMFEFSTDLTVLNGITVTINQVDPLVEWVQMDNPLYLTCITGYMIEDQDNQTLNHTVESSTRSITAQQLNAAGFPYCTTIRPIVTPITPMGPLMSAPESNNLTTSLIDPDFPSPMLSDSFTLVSETVMLRVSVQNISESVVPTRHYQYTTNGTTSPMMNFTDYFEIELPGAEAGQMVSVTVVFTKDSCSSTNTANFTVPPMEIADVEEGEPTDTSQSITITLPLTEYQPEQLLIISTVQPSDDGPIMANYTSHSMQYTVTFTDLDPVTEYTFTIRIVLRSNTTVDVVPFVTGTFLTLMMATTPPQTTTPMAGTTMEVTLPPSPPSPCGIGCIIGIIVCVLVLGALVTVIIVICVVCFSKRSKTVKISSHEMEEQKTHKLKTAPDGDKSDPSEAHSPTSDTFKNQNPEDTTSEGTDGASGATGGEKETLIYADLDLAKGKKPKPQAPSGPALASGGDEDVQYAVIAPSKKPEES